jgi:signal peptidase II
MHIFWITFTIVVIDQITKQVVLRSMYVGQSIELIGDWLKFTFTENPGMAFGITFGPRGMVTFLSMAATGLIVVYLYRVRHLYKPYRVSIACILGGALGNIIDRVFYGMLFNDAPLFAGKVVDFIHVNLWRGYLPEAWPLVGGKYTALFPIWNVADMAIVLGVLGILFFQGAFQEELMREQQTKDAESAGVSHAGASEAGGLDVPEKAVRPEGSSQE